MTNTNTQLQAVTDSELATVEGGAGALVLAGAFLAGAAIGYIVVAGRPQSFKAEIGEDGMPIEEDYRDGPIVLK